MRERWGAPGSLSSAHSMLWGQDRRGSRLICSYWKARRNLAMTLRIFLAAWTFGAVLLQVPSALAADWTQKLPANSPPARNSHAMAYDAARGQDVLFGGSGANNGLLSDTWVWDGSNWA